MPLSCDDAYSPCPGGQEVADSDSAASKDSSLPYQVDRSYVRIRSMEQPRRSTFPGFPEHCRLSHLWKPGTVIIDWRPCECRPASAARGGHLEVICGTPGCPERWQRPLHEAPWDPGSPPARTLAGCPGGSEKVPSCWNHRSSPANGPLTAMFGGWRYGLHMPLDVKNKVRIESELGALGPLKEAYGCPIAKYVQVIFVQQVSQVRV